MKKRTLTMSAHSVVSSPTNARPRTGEHCPVNGWWAPLNRRSPAHFLTEGSIMPADGGTAVVWTLVERPHPSPTPNDGYPALRLPADSY